MANFQSTIELKAVTHDIDRKLKGVRKQIDGVGDRIRKSTSRMTRFSKEGSQGLKRVDKSAKSVNRSFSKMQSKLTSITGKMKMFGGLFGSILGIQGVASAAKFEKGMSAVRATTNASATDMAKLTKEALKLGASTKFTAGEASDAMLKLSMAGFSANETFKATADTLALASAGALGLGESADIASNVLAGFDLKVKDLARVTDVMAKAAASSNTSVGELGSALSYVGPVAEQSGLSIEDTVAAIGKLSDAGIKGTRAGTNVRAMLLRLQKPSAEAGRYLAKLGIKTRDAEGKFRPFVQIMKEFGTATQDSADFAGVFGRVASSGAGVLAKAATRGSIQTLGASLRDASGAAQQMADIRLDNLSGSVTLMTSAWDGLMQQLMQGAGLETMRAWAESTTRNIVKVTAGLKFLQDNHQKVWSNVGKHLEFAKLMFVRFFDVMNYGPGYVFARLSIGLKEMMRDMWNSVSAYRIDVLFLKIQNAVSDILADISLLFLEYKIKGPLREWNKFWAVGMTIPITRFFKDIWAVMRKKGNWFGNLLPQMIKSVKLEILLGGITSIMSTWGDENKNNLFGIGSRMFQALVRGIKAGVKKLKPVMGSIHDIFSFGFDDALDRLASTMKERMSEMARITHKYSKLFLMFPNSFSVFDGWFKVNTPETHSKLEGMRVQIKSSMSAIIKDTRKAMSGFVSDMVEPAWDIRDGVVGAFQNLWEKLIGNSIIWDIIDDSTSAWKNFFVNPMVDMAWKLRHGVVAAFGSMGKHQSVFTAGWRVVAKSVKGILKSLIYNLSDMWYVFSQSFNIGWDISLGSVKESVTGFSAYVTHVFGNLSTYIIRSLQAVQFGIQAVFGSSMVTQGIGQLASAVAAEAQIINSIGSKIAPISIPLAVVFHWDGFFEGLMKIEDRIREGEWVEALKVTGSGIDAYFAGIFHSLGGLLVGFVKIINSESTSLFNLFPKVFSEVEKIIQRIGDELEGITSGWITAFGTGAFKLVHKVLGGMLELLTGINSGSLLGGLITTMLTLKAAAWGVAAAGKAIKSSLFAGKGERKSNKAEKKDSMRMGDRAVRFTKGAAGASMSALWEASSNAARMSFEKMKVYWRVGFYKPFEKDLHKAKVQAATFGDTMASSTNKARASTTGFMSGILASVNATKAKLKSKASLAGIAVGGKGGATIGLKLIQNKFKAFSARMLGIHRRTSVSAAQASSSAHSMAAGMAASQQTGASSGKRFKLGMGSVLAGVSILSMFSMSSADASELGEDVGQSVTEGIETALRDQAQSGGLMGAMMDWAAPLAYLIGTGVYTGIFNGFQKARALIAPFAARLAAAMSLGALGIPALIAALTVGLVAAVAGLVYGIAEAGHALHKHFIKPLGFAIDDMVTKMSKANVIRAEGFGTSGSKDLFGDWDSSLTLIKNLKKVGQNFKSNVTGSIAEAGRVVSYLYEKVINKSTIALVKAGYLDPVHNVEAFLRDQTQILLEAGKSIKDIAGVTNLSSIYTIKPVVNAGFNEELGEQLLKSTVILDKGMEDLWNKYANTTPKWIENFDLKGIKEELHALINEQVSAGTMDHGNWIFDDDEEAVEFVTKELGLAKAAVNGLNAALKAGKITSDEYRGSVKTLTNEFKEGAVKAGIAMKDSFTLMPPLIQEITIAQAKLSEAIREEANHRLKIVNAVSKTKLDTVIANKQLAVFSQIVEERVRAVNTLEMKGFANKFQALDQEHKKVLAIAALKAKLGLIDVTTEDPTVFFKDWLTAQEKMLSVDERREKKLKEIELTAKKLIAQGKLQGVQYEKYIQSQMGDLDKIHSTWGDIVEDSLSGTTAVEKATADLAAAEAAYQAEKKVTNEIDREALALEWEKIKVQKKLAIATAKTAEVADDAEKARKAAADVKKLALSKLDTEIRAFNLTARAAQRTVAGLVGTFKAAMKTLEKEFVAAYGEGWKSDLKMLAHYNRIKAAMTQKHNMKVLLLSKKGTDGIRVAVQKMFLNLKTTAELFADAMTKSMQSAREGIKSLLMGKDTDVKGVISGIFENFQGAMIDDFLNTALKGSGLEGMFGVGDQEMLDGQTKEKAKWVRMSDGKGDAGGPKMPKVDKGIFASIANFFKKKDGTEKFTKEQKAMWDQGVEIQNQQAAWDSLFPKKKALADESNREWDEMLGEKELTFGETLSNGWQNLGEVLSNAWQSLSSIFSSLFSGGGGGSGGGLGGMLGGIGGLFGGGSAAGGGGALASMTAGAGSGGLPAMASIGTFGLSEGGIVPQYFSSGGAVAKGTDTVPTMLTPGEVVLNAGQQSNVADAIQAPMGEGIQQSGGIAAIDANGGTAGDGNEEIPTDPLGYLYLLIKKQREATAVSAQEAAARMAVLGQEGIEGGAIVAEGASMKAEAVEDGEARANEARTQGTAAQKASSMISAAISTALGVVMALGDPSVPFTAARIALAAVIGVMGAVQIGMIASAKTGGRITHGGVDVSDGGKLRGAGTGISDSIPAMLSNGEYVINAAQTQKYGGVLAAINAGLGEGEILGRMTNRPVGAFATGGLVGSSIPTVSSEASGMMGSGSTYNTTHINVSGNVDQRSIDQIRRVISQSPKQVHGASLSGKRAKTGIRKTG